MSLFQRCQRLFPKWLTVNYFVISRCSYMTDSPYWRKRKLLQKQKQEQQTRYNEKVHSTIGSTKSSARFIIHPIWSKVYSQCKQIGDELIYEMKDEYNSFITKPTLNNIKSQFSQIADPNDDTSFLPLYGMPIIVKDNIMTKHSLYPSYAGSTSFKNLNFESPQNAPIIQKLINLGAIIFGKTNMHEFAFGITSNNQGFGCCINPIDNDKICGGSSGGTAAAIAAGYATIGLGTDTGGSMRIPAACCNIIGYLPTQDRYSFEGVFKLTHTTDTIGIMSTNIDEIVRVDAALTGYEAYDPTDGIHKIIRVGIPKIHFQHEVHPNIINSFNKVLDLLHIDNRFELVYGNDEYFGNDLNGTAISAIKDIVGYEFPREAEKYLNQYCPDITLRKLLENSTGNEKDLMLSFLDENIVEIEQYNEAINKINTMKNIFINYFFNANNLDIMVYPTITVEPPLRIKEEIELESNGKKYDSFTKMIQNTQPTANIGFPCITIPGINVPESSFACGFEMCGLPHSDETLLKIARCCIGLIKDTKM